MGPTRLLAEETGASTQCAVAWASKSSGVFDIRDPPPETIALNIPATTMKVR